MIYTPKNGPVRVLVDGKQVRRCFYADTVRGIADCYREPPKLDKWKKRALSFRVRGKVTVEAMS